jgi:sorting nexin-27
MLPDRSITNLKIHRYSTADKVYEILAKNIKLPSESTLYFYLFEVLDYNFQRKLRPNEYPHRIYVQNCCTSATTSLSLRKFIFSPSIENQLLKNPLTCDYLYREVFLSYHDSFVILFCKP